MKIEILRGCGCKGKNLEAGKEYEVDDADGRYLCLLGKAKPVVEAIKDEPEKVEPEKAAPKKRGRKKAD